MELGSFPVGKRASRGETSVVVESDVNETLQDWIDSLGGGSSESDIDETLQGWADSLGGDTSDSEAETGKIQKMQPLEGAALLSLKAVMNARKITSSKKLLKDSTALDKLKDTVGGFATITARGSADNAKGVAWYRGFFDRVVQPALKKDKELEAALDPFLVIICHPLPPTFAADLAACPPYSAMVPRGANPGPTAPMLADQNYMYSFPHDAEGIKAAVHWIGKMQGRDANYEFVATKSTSAVYHH